MTAGVFVGVDSGGTRTNIEMQCIAAGGATRNASYEDDESLSGALAPELIPGVLRRILAPLELHLDDADRSLPIYVWISAAGFTRWTRDDFVAAIHDVGPTVAGAAIRCVGVSNDAVALLLGSRADGVVIAGTGSNVLVRASDGALYQAGGHEWVACDYGSGFWIGLRSIRQAYRDYEAGVDSVLLQRVRHVYGVRPTDDSKLIEKLRDLAISDQHMKKEIARLAATVCAAAERGDEGAQNIVKAEAEDLADVMAGSLRRRLGVEALSRGFRIVQCGSLLGNDFYRSAFEQQLEMRLLSGLEHRADISWHRTVTGGTEAVQLARDIAGDASQMLRLDLAFRPAVVAL